MIFRSLRSRLWLTYVLVIAVALSIVAGVIVIYLARNPIQSFQARVRLQTSVDNLTRRISAANPETKAQMAGLAQRVDAAFDTRMLLFDSLGNLLIDSRRKQAAPLRLHLPDRGLADKRKVAVRITKDTHGKEWLYVAKPVPEMGIIVSAVPRPTVGFWAALRSRGDDLWPMFRCSGSVAMVLGLVLAFWIAKWVSSPLMEIIDATEKIPSGEYAEIEIKGPEEVRSLAAAFNTMSRKVDRSQQSMKDFVANVSHELKTPLTSIRGFAQAIQDGTADTPDEKRQAAAIIASEADQMYRIVMDLLDLARYDAGSVVPQIETVDCNLLLERVIEKFSHQASSKNVRITTNFRHIPVIQADQHRLMQVFSNLLDNAIKYSFAGGDVLLSTKRAGGYIEIGFQDTGIGIEEEDIPRIFERFYRGDKSRTSDATKGTGLGLAIAKEIVISMGGSILVSSEPGKGSTFVVKLPIGASGRKAATLSGKPGAGQVVAEKTKNTLKGKSS